MRTNYKSFDRNGKHFEIVSKGNRYQIARTDQNGTVSFWNGNTQDFGGHWTATITRSYVAAERILDSIEHQEA